MHRKIVSVVVLSALLALIFTGSTGNVAISAGNSNPAALPAQSDEFETSDDRLAAIAAQVPGFGGVFYGEDETLQVYMLGQNGLVDAASMLFLEDVITREVGKGKRLSHKGVEILEGQYSFLDLYNWQQQMSPAMLTLPGVVFTDIDERSNRLRIGITDSPGMAEAVERYYLQWAYRAKQCLSVKPKKYGLNSEVAAGPCVAVCKSTSAVSYARSVLSLPARASPVL